MDISDAVITVPVGFDHLQRLETYRAAARAGFEGVRIVDEPVAGAWTYAMNHMQKDASEESVLVFNLGGASLDVAVLSIDDQEIIVESTDGDMNLGGDDFTSVLVDHCAAQLLNETKIDIKKNARQLQRLRNKCETAKKELTTATFRDIDFNIICQQELEITISRSDFNRMCSPLFDRCIETLIRCIDNANKTNKDIQKVILLGGSSRMPYI